MVRIQTYYLRAIKACPDSGVVITLVELQDFVRTFTAVLQDTSSHVSHASPARCACTKAYPLAHEVQARTFTGRSVSAAFGETYEWRRPCGIEIVVIRLLRCSALRASFSSRPKPVLNVRRETSCRTI